MKRILKFLIAIFVFIALLSILTACSDTDPINDRPLTVSDITVETKNVKTEIIAGESLDLSALIVKTVMSDDSWTVLSEGETGYTVNLSEFNNQIHGIYTVYVTHGLFTKSFTVTVLPRLTAIELASDSAQKTEFLWAEAFSASGLKINKVMSDGDKIELSSEDYNIDFSAYASTNTQNIGRSYTIKISLKSDANKFTIYSVNVGARPAPVPQSISITSPNKTNYTIGESLNLTGGKITVKHDWGEGIDIDLTSDLLTVSLADTSKGSEQQLITVTHISTGFKTTFKINVRKQISSISIFSLPTKLNYTAGEAISLAGGIINLNFNDSSISKVYMNDESSFSVIGYSCTYSTFNKDGDGKEGFKTATVTLKGYNFSVNFDYYVPPKIKTLTWITAPSSTYFLGDPDYIETGVLKATYDDEAATSFNVDLNEDRQAESQKLNITGFSTLSQTLDGVATIALKNQEISIDINYTVRDDRPVSIVLLKEPDKKDYSGTDTTPDLSGGEVEITFLSGETEILSLPEVLPHADFSATNIEIGSAGERKETQTITVSFKNTVSIGYDITFTVTCTGFTIISEPDNLSYKHNAESYSFEGGIIAKSYDNGATENEISMFSETFTENYTVEGWADNQDPGDYQFTITDKTEPDFTTTLDYSIVDHVTDFSLTTLPTKLNYFKGDLADYTGAVATVKYSFGGDMFFDDITEIKLFTITEFTTYYKGENILTVTHNESGKQTTFSISVLNRVKSITLKTTIPKTNYNKNELLDPAEGLLSVIYDFNLSTGNNTEDISTDTTGLNNAGDPIGGGDLVLTDLRVTFPDFSTELSTDSTGRDATVEFGGATTIFTYFVTRLLTGLEWNVTPHKTAYVIEEALDLSFASVYIVYDYTDKVRVNLDEDQKKVEAARLFTVTGFDSSIVGTFNYTVTFKEDTSKTLLLEYSVASSIVSELELIYKPDTALLFGDEFYFSGVTFRRYFTDGTEDIVTLPADDKITASGFYSDSLTDTPRAITFTAVGTSVTNSEIIYTISDWVSDFIVDSYPSKTVYYKDESVLDLSGGAYHLIWAGVGATSQYVMEDSVIASLGLDTTAEKTVEDGALITLTYNTATKEPLTATYNYVVKDKVASIALTTNPTKDVYYIGQDLNLAGGVITIAYDFNEPETVNLPQEGFTATLDTSTSTLGENRAMTITHTSSSFFCQFMVPVYTRNLNSLTIETAPDNLTYYKDDTIDLSGGIIKLNYSAGEPDFVSMLDSGVSIFSGDTGTVSASVAVNLSYLGIVSSSFSIEVLRSLVAISISVMPITIYKLNDTLDLTGGILTLTYDDASTETLSLDSEDIIVEGFDLTIFGEQTLTVTFEGKTTSYTVTVKPFIISLDITTSGTASFVYDTEFNCNNLIVSATYDYDPESLGNPREISAGAGFDGYTIDSSEYVQYSAGEYTIYVYWSYDQDIFTSYLVTVNESEVIKSVNLTGEPIVIIGYTNETYSQLLTRYSEATFDIIYTDSRTETLNLSNATSDYELSNTVASDSVIITFTYMTFDFTVEAQILEKAVSSITWNTNPIGTQFYEGDTEAYILSGGIINVYYNNGESQIIALVTDGVVCSGVTTNLLSLVPGTDEATSAVIFIIYFEGLSLEREIQYFIVE